MMCLLSRGVPLLLRHAQSPSKVYLVFFFSQELKAFGDRCESLAREFADSEAFNRKCAIYTAFTIMDTFARRLESMESEAQVRE